MNALTHAYALREHGPEPEPGLPEPLPAQESVLWRGGPSFRALATGVFHLRLLAAYFVALGAWRLGVGVSGGAAWDVALLDGLQLTGLGMVPVALLTLYAWGIARSSVYTITQRRVVLRIGVALPVTINLPYAAVVAAGVREGRDGAGDIALTLSPAHGVPWAMLWPHARPWRMARAEPSLRALADVHGVAAILARALAAEAGMAVPAAAAAAGAAEPGYAPGGAVPA